MLDSDIAKGNKKQNKKKLCPSNRTPHDKKYPFLQEFSELIAKVSIELLETRLITSQQRKFATELWEAENFGGSKEKCKKRMQDIHGDNWREITTIKSEMNDIRPYYEQVLLIDHCKQWDVFKKSANIS